MVTNSWVITNSGLRKRKSAARHGVVQPWDTNNRGRRKANFNTRGSCKANSAV
jgi:hypothetical protein